jgi:hypothetical protein
MKKLFIVSCSAAMAFGLIGCGGGKALPDGKEGAAQGLTKVFQAMGVVMAAAAQQSSLASGATYESSGTATCPEGGSAQWAYELTTTDTGTGTSTYDYTIEYNTCDIDGKSILDGNVGISFVLQSGSSGSGNYDYTYNGRVDLSGDIEDFVDMDVHQVGSYTGAGTGNVQFHMTLTGTITTSSGSYTFDNEDINVSTDS